MRFLGDRAIPIVMVDGPQGFKSSVPPIVATTSPDLALIRFHGRRTETWEKQNIKTVERFRYLYDDDELQDWAPKVREAAGAVEGHACPVQQLLRQLRRDERDRVRPDAPRPGGRRAGLVRSRGGKTAPDDPRLSCSMAESHFVPGFRPSDDGLHFPNSFPSGPTIRSACWIAHRRHRGCLERVVRRDELLRPAAIRHRRPGAGDDDRPRQRLRPVQAARSRAGPLAAARVVPMRFWRLASMNAAERAARTRDRGGR